MDVELVTLPSGAKLEITPSPFGISKSLYQAVAEEFKGLKLDLKAEVDGNFIKDLACVAVSSKKIETCLEDCMKRALYNGVKIDKDTFEPVKAREDYLTVCYEVARVNLLPFTKSLSAQFSQVVGMLRGSQA